MKDYIRQGQAKFPGKRLWKAGGRLRAKKWPLYTAKEWGTPRQAPAIAEGDTAKTSVPVIQCSGLATKRTEDLFPQRSSATVAQQPENQ